MSNGPEPKSPAKPTSPDDALPPVEAPTLAFVTQLFLIPLLIVSIIVVIWLGVTWMVSSGSDPENYVEDLQNPGKGSWQSAASLADMLRNPRNDKLKRNTALASRLAEALDKQIDAGEMSNHAIKLRIFLCRALGEFYVTAGLPVLIKAVNTQRREDEIVVQRTALEAIAVLADNTDPTQVLKQPGLMTALRQASQLGDSGSPEDVQQYGDLRARAAFTLGVLGGAEALDQLAVICEDGYTNASYNAATGLARHGDLRAKPVLLEMLDPQNADVVADEKDKTNIAWKRALVMINGMEAFERLALQNPKADFSELEAAVSNLVTAKLNPLIAGQVHTLAKELQLKLQSRKQR